MTYEDRPTRAEAERDAYLDRMDERREQGLPVFQCGHCGLPHATVDEVRHCADVEYGNVD